MDSEINFNSDFLNFKDQIVEKFGDQYLEQVNIFLERAITEATQGLFHNAAADGKFALELHNYSKNNIGIQYLFGFLSQLHCDMGQISKSKAYYDLGIKFLDPNDKDDIRLFEGLKELIDGESWKGMQDDNADNK